MALTRASTSGGTSRPLILQGVGFGAKLGDASLVRLGRQFVNGFDRAAVLVIAIRQVDQGLDPLPAFGPDLVRLGVELLGDQAVEQGRIGQPAAIIGLEQVARRRHTASREIGIEPDEQHPGVRHRHHVLGQLVADEAGRLVDAVVELLPELLLAGVIVADREGHELVERHVARGIDLVQLGRDRGELQALAHHGRRHAEMRGDRLFALTLVSQELHAAELVERVKRLAMAVLRKRVFLGQDRVVGRLDDARDRRVLGETLAFHEDGQRAIAAAARGNLEQAGFGAIGVDLGPHTEPVQEATALDVVGQVFNRHAVLDAADVRLGQDQLVEGNIPRRAEDDLWGGGFCHVNYSMTGRRETLSRLSSPSQSRRPPSHSLGRRHSRSGCRYTPHRPSHSLAQRSSWPRSAGVLRSAWSSGTAERCR